VKTKTAFRTALLAFFLTACLAVPGMATSFVPVSPTLAVSELRPGMSGEAHTVLKGQSVVKFPVTIVSVIPKKGVPKHLVLIRASGPLIEKTGGIAAGMSGSPVFIDGKLIGAIGYGWNFSDHKLGLVTPIEDMVSVFDWKDIKPDFYRAPPQAPAPSSDDVVSADVTSGDVEPEGAEPGSAPGREVDETTGPDKETKGLSVLFADGLSERAIENLSGKLNHRILSVGGNPGLDVPPVQKVGNMVPGEAVGVLLAWGDVNLGATGTLTTVSKDGRFVAFAHPFINGGAVAYPLTKAWVHDVIPSIESPFKLGTPLSIIGTVTQDRPQAIGGRLNVYPPSFDFTVNFDDVDNKRKDKKRFHIAMAPFLLSKLSPEALSGLLDDLWGQIGAGTAKLSLTVEGPDIPRGWTRNNIFFSDKDLTKETLKEFKELVDIIALNPFTEIAPLGFRLDVEMTATPRILLIEDVKLEKKKFRPGEKVKVEVTLRPYRKVPFKRTFELTVPQNAIGKASIIVRGGGIGEPEQDSILEGKTTIRNLPALLEELSVRETNNQVVVEILAQESPKARTGGKALPEDEDIEDPDDKPELLSEITEKKIKEGSMRLFNSNFFVDGLQKRDISVTGNFQGGAQP